MTIVPLLLNGTVSLSISVTYLFLQNSFSISFTEDKCAYRYTLHFVQVRGVRIAQEERNGFVLITGPVAVEGVSPGPFPQRHKITAEFHILSAPTHDLKKLLMLIKM